MAVERIAAGATHRMKLSPPPFPLNFIQKANFGSFMTTLVNKKIVWSFLSCQTVSIQDREVRAARKFSFNWRWHRWLPIPGDTQLHLYDGGDVFFSRWLLQFWEVHSTQNLLEVSSLPVFFENDLNTSRQPGCGPVLRVLCALGCHSQQH